MNNNYLVHEKATVCHNSTCVTVYGDTARIVNDIVVTAVAIGMVALIFKSLE
ncbi:MAG: hypothetical protein ACK5RV_00145 [Flavobacterium sp.]|jgi:hypothetical protein|uniref:hypothetical protein n=1 Tax=Flavobacterium sp. TaxID=239 RepID=UPI0022C6C7D2|nr:hypothetical protein [Flavobacterium sp.]MCZ8297027.1 hypothetical protein [Flavobacterium sp.]